MSTTNHPNTCYVIAGPTASGKTGHAVKLAYSLNQDCVIINADSLQIYQGLPILTACPTQEEKRGIPHVLFEQFEPHEKCSVGRWWDLATEQIHKTFDNNKVPIVVGGTGLYLKSLISGLPATPDVDPDIREQAQERLKDIGNEAFHQELASFDPVLAARLFPGDSQRLMRGWEVFHGTGKPLSLWQKETPRMIPFDIQFDYHQIVPNRDDLYQRCNDRFDLMVNSGAVEETQAFMARYGEDDLPACQALGYRELRSYCQGDMTLEDACEQAKTATRRYAKRQLTWLRNQMTQDQLGDLCYAWHQESDV